MRLVHNMGKYGKEPNIPVKVRTYQTYTVDKLLSYTDISRTVTF